MDLKFAIAQTKTGFAMKTQHSAMLSAARAPRRRHGRFAPLIAFVLLAFPSHAHASFLHGETLDAVAGAIAWFAFIIVPPVLIVAFLAVHIIPEKIAEKRHHPQLGAIKCLCFLSLVFGGLLWPIAWLWAYSKPVFHKMAYGTDVDHSHDQATEEKSATSELEQLRGRVAELEAEIKRGKA
jgi:CBS domain containing-hemolysin-like protein